MSEHFLLQANQLHRYYGRHHAVNDVSLHLKQGEVLGLLGPNGAGKSTTMKMLTGNLAPASGEIRILEHDLLDNPRQAKAKIGYLPEQPPVYRDMTVREYLTYCAKLRKLPSGSITENIDRVFQQCDLASVHKRLIGNLSKGYQQRVGIAQAILHQPPVIILDEPTVGLDPVQIREIRQLIRDLGDEYGVILSTHILPEVQAVCDRVQIIHQGSTVYENTLNQDDSATTTRYEIIFRHSVNADTLSNFDAVKTLIKITDSHYQIQLIDTDSIDNVLSFISENRWPLKELSPSKTNLENIFLELVHGQEQAA